MNKSVTKTKSTAGEFLQKFGKSLNEYAIREYNESAFLKSAMIAISNNKQLEECLKSDKGKLSLFNALRYAATTGLSLNPQEGKAALVGYKNKKGEFVVNYQVMKNGMIDLALDSHKIEFLTSDYVKENDHFDLEKSVHGDEYTFKPALENRGSIIGFFAALKMKTGLTHVKWLTTDEVCNIRDTYSSMYKFKKDDSAWEKSFSGMGVKTVMKALLRGVSISTDLDTAIGADDFYEAEFKVEAGVSAEEATEKLEKPEPKVEPEKQGDLL